MTDFINGIGTAIGSLVQSVVDAATGAFFGLVHMVDAIVPGGFAVFVVLCVIGALVGWASLKR